MGARNLRGAKSGGKAFELCWRGEDLALTVEKLFRGEPSNERMGEIRFIFLVGLIWIRRQLISDRAGDHADQMPEVKFVLDEITGQRLEQLRMRGRIGGTKIVDRVDDSPSHQMKPDAIGLG